jgi:hypothetical protein
MEGSNPINVASIAGREREDGRGSVAEVEIERLKRYRK